MWFSLFAVVFVCVLECFLLKGFRVYKDYPECVIKRDRRFLVIMSLLAVIVLVVAKII